MLFEPGDDLVPRRLLGIIEGNQSGPLVICGVSVLASGL
jgi:hypothetical protein